MSPNSGCLIFLSSWYTPYFDFFCFGCSRCLVVCNVASGMYDERAHELVASRMRSDKETTVTRASVRMSVKE